MWALLRPRIAVALQGLSGRMASTLSYFARTLLFLFPLHLVMDPASLEPAIALAHCSSYSHCISCPTSEKRRRPSDASRSSAVTSCTLGHGTSENRLFANRSEGCKSW